MFVFGMITSCDSHFSTIIALESFLAYTDLARDDLFYLIDNTCDFELPEHLNFAQLRIIRNPKEISYTKNINKFIAIAEKRDADLILLNNNLAFTYRWFEPLRGTSQDIISVLTNREIQYSTKEFQLEASCTIENYCKIAKEVPTIVDYHRSLFPEEHEALICSFAASKIPLVLLQTIGKLDESFGDDTNADYDYCLRAQESGFKARYAAGSYLIHFGDQSLWDSRTVDLAESYFTYKFLEKWGDRLDDFLNDTLVNISKLSSQLISEVTVEEISNSDSNFDSGLESLVQVAEFNNQQGETPLLN